MRQKWRLSSSSQSSCSATTAAGRLLVAMIGNLRGGEQAWLSMEHRVLNPLKADLALLASSEDLAAIGPSSVLVRRARFVWRVREYYDWGEAIDEVLGGRGWRSNVTLSVGLWGGVRYPGRCKTWCKRAPRREILRGAGAITLTLRMMLLRQLDELPKDAYATVMLTRSDYLYACEHPAIAAAPNTVHVPAGEDHMGLNDRHQIFSFASRRAALAVLPWLAAGGCRGCIAIESALRGYFESLRDMHVCRYEPPMFTVARHNESTSWVRPHATPPPRRALQLFFTSPSCSGPQAERCHALKRFDPCATTQVQRSENAVPLLYHCC